MLCSPQRSQRKTYYSYSNIKFNSLKYKNKIGVCKKAIDKEECKQWR